MADPDVLWHYTSDDAARQIVSRRGQDLHLSMWLSDVTTMDDTTEAALVELCRTALSRAGLPTEVEQLLDFPMGAAAGENGAASFTTSRDEFMQWNRPGAEVALGIRRDSLSSRVTYWASLSEVTYTTEEEIVDTARRFIRHQFEYWFARMSGPGGPSFSVGDASTEFLRVVADAVERGVRHWVGMTAATQKLDVFKDEKEVRFLQRFPVADDASTTSEENARLAETFETGVVRTAPRHLVLELTSGLDEMILKQGSKLEERRKWWTSMLQGGRSQVRLTNSHVPFRR